MYALTQNTLKITAGLGVGVLSVSCVLVCVVCLVCVLVVSCVCGGVCGVAR